MEDVNEPVEGETVQAETPVEGGTALEEASKIRIAHPDVEGETLTTREAYDQLWAAKGWSIVEDGAPVQGGDVLTPAPVTDTAEAPADAENKEA